MKKKPALTYKTTQPQKSGIPVIKITVLSLVTLFCLPFCCIAVNGTGGNKQREYTHSEIPVEELYPVLKPVYGTEIEMELIESAKSLANCKAEANRIEFAKQIERLKHYRREREIRASIEDSRRWAESEGRRY
jgi:hypothetical protein